MPVAKNKSVLQLKHVSINEILLILSPVAMNNILLKCYLSFSGSMLYNYKHCCLNRIARTESQFDCVRKL